MLSAVVWALIGLSSSTAVAVGVLRHRPARIGPWVLLGASVVALAVGDVCYALKAFTAADISYFAMFLLVALCLLQLTRDGAVLVDRASLIDLVAFTCSATLVLWVCVLNRSGDLGSISPADVLGALLLVVVSGRLIAAAGRNWSAILLGVGAVGLLIGDLTYPLHPGPLTELGFLTLYVAWGAAALHPSMTQLTRPVQQSPRPWRSRWAALLGISVATPPGVLLIQAVSGGVTDGVIIAAASGITLVLTITRLGDSIDQHSRALARERGLREASAALVAAADTTAVDEAVRDAVGHLMPRSAVDRLIFATDDRQLAMSALPPARSGPRPRSWWLDEPAGRPDAGTDTDEATLICPLWLEPLAVARPSGGALVLVGRRDTILATRDALEVLAGQAALALDRISLVEAVGRRDSDLYLRAVIRNTEDIMLVTDDDQRIRYASPAFTELLGGEPPPLATLHDLVHPDDRAQVRTSLLTEGNGDGTLFCALQRQDGTQVLVEATYRDLRADRLVQGFVITMRDLTECHEPTEHRPHRGTVDDLPGWVNRRSARGKFRF